MTAFMTSAAAAAARAIQRLVSQKDALELEASMTRTVVDNFIELGELNPGNAEKYAKMRAVHEKKTNDLLKEIGEVELRIAEENKLREELLQEADLSGTLMKTKVSAPKDVSNVEKTPGIEVSTACDGVHAVAREAEIQGFILDGSGRVPFHAADGPNLPPESTEPSVQASYEPYPGIHDKNQGQGVPAKIEYSESFKDEYSDVLTNHLSGEDRIRWTHLRPGQVACYTCEDTSRSGT